MKSIRVGVIGCGYWGPNLVRNFARHPNSEVEAVCDMRYERAMRVLRTRVFEQQQAKLHRERAEARRNQIGSGDRNERIRTYNFPQNRVTDHRINLNLYKLDAIIAGDLGDLIRALKDFDKQQRLDQAK